eukprot:9097308-Pyramimonas_sp.AAC.1
MAAEAERLCGSPAHPACAGPCTVGANAKRHPACLQGGLGFLVFDGFAMENVTSRHHKPMDVLGSQGWVCCGRFLVVGDPD